MRISKAPNAAPHSAQPSGAGSRADAAGDDNQFIWISLVPRLVHPTQLAIIKALIEEGRPLSVDELMPLLPADENSEVIRYHAKAMTKAGALEVAETQVTAAAEVPRFFFPRPQ